MARVYHHWDTEAELTLTKLHLEEEVETLREQLVEKDTELRRKDWSIKGIVDQHQKEVKNTWIAGLSIGLAIGLIVGVITSISW